MAIFNSQYFPIDSKETRRYAGLQKAEFSQLMIDEACTEAQLLMQPKGSWHLYPYDACTATINSPTPFPLQGQKIAQHLADCTQVVALTATVGDSIEEQVSAYFKEGKYSYSLLLDAAATTAVEQLADNIEKAIYNEVKKMGLQMKWRFSPGYGDWPMEQQPPLLQLAGGPEIGVSLTQSLMLTPRKSITAIIGLYPSSTPAAPKKPKHNCAQCNKLDCPSRQSAQ